MRARPVCAYMASYYSETHEMSSSTSKYVLAAVAVPPPRPGCYPTEGGGGGPSDAARASSAADAPPLGSQTSPRRRRRRRRNAAAGPPPPPPPPRPFTSARTKRRCRRTARIDAEFAAATKDFEGQDEIDDSAPKAGQMTSTSIAGQMLQQIKAYQQQAAMMQMQAAQRDESPPRLVAPPPLPNTHALAPPPIHPHMETSRIHLKIIGILDALSFKNKKK